MPQPLSLRKRNQVIEYIGAGLSNRQIAEAIGCGLSSVYKYQQLTRQVDGVTVLSSANVSRLVLFLSLKTQGISSRIAAQKVSTTQSLLPLLYILHSVFLLDISL